MALLCGQGEFPRLCPSHSGVLQMEGFYDMAAQQSDEDIQGLMTQLANTTDANGSLNAIVLVPLYPQIYLTCLFLPR